MAKILPMVRHVEPWLQSEELCLEVYLEVKAGLPSDTGGLAARYIALGRRTSLLDKRPKTLAP